MKFCKKSWNFKNSEDRSHIMLKISNNLNLKLMKRIRQEAESPLEWSNSFSFLCIHMNYGVEDQEFDHYPDIQSLLKTFDRVEFNFIPKRVNSRLLNLILLGKVILFGLISSRFNGSRKLILAVWFCWTVVLVLFG